VMDRNGCSYMESFIVNKQKLLIDELLDCSAFRDTIVLEDSYGASIYTHYGTGWDISPTITSFIDSARYLIGDTIYDSGIGSSLDGAIFNMGVNYVTVIAYLGPLTDTCEFTVTVNRDCDLSNLAFTAEVEDMTLLLSGDTIYGKIIFTVTGGIPPYQYSTDGITWTLMSGATDSITDLISGTYLIKVMDKYGCTYEESFVVKEQEEEIIGALICEAFTDQIVDEDAPGAGIYTHWGTDWDIDPAIAILLDSATYFIDGVIYQSGISSSLNGATFNLGVSTVMVIGYYLTFMDTCEFTVTVERVCPPSVTDFEGKTYTVTKLAGLCWTHNLRSTQYWGGDPIAWANPYQSTIHFDIAAHDTIFGLLYSWYSAVGAPEPENYVMMSRGRSAYVRGVCPEGWHIPSQAELNLLSSFPAEDLKSTQHWLTPGNDLYGFDARPAGMYDGATDKFINLYGFTGWWAHDTDIDQYAYYFYLTYYCNNVQPQKTLKSDGLSVRCIMD